MHENDGTATCTGFIDVARAALHERSDFRWEGRSRRLRLDEDILNTAHAGAFGQRKDAHFRDIEWSIQTNPKYQNPNARETPNIKIQKSRRARDTKIRELSRDRT